MNDTEEYEAPTAQFRPIRQDLDTEAVPDLAAVQDEIATPTPITPPASTTWAEPAQETLGPATWTESPRARASGALKLAVALALLFSVAALALNAVLIYSLLNVRQTATDGLDAALAAVDDFGGKGFHYDYHFEQTIPVSTAIPIQQDMVFPFKGEVPIKTTVKVPINVLGRTIVVEVPIDTVFPVDVEVPIHVDQTFRISTTIPVSMDIPIDVQADDPEIQQLLGGVRDWLVRLRNTFY